MSGPLRVLVTLSGDDPADLRHGIRERHLRPLVEAGLVPVLLAGSLPGPALAELAGGCVAAYLPGTDYVPSVLGEGAAASRAGAAAAGLAWDPHKVRADLWALDFAWERGIPLLGVCGGMQAMVIHAGGTLRAGTAAELERHGRREAPEAVELANGSLAAEVLAGGAAAVNSHHRQVVDRLPDGLVAGARALDGVVEAVESPRGRHPFWLGIQWHPELLTDARPFRALARAAAERMS